jgi:hypothetical protein
MLEVNNNSDNFRSRFVELSEGIPHRFLGNSGNFRELPRGTVAIILETIAKTPIFS